MSKHKHDFVPVGVTWKKYWYEIQGGRLPIPAHVVQACTCGAVRLVKARLVEEKKNG